MSLLIAREMPSVCRKCKEQGKLAGGWYRVHTDDDFLNAYCDGDPSTGCPIIGEVNLDGFTRVIVTSGDGTVVGYKDISARQVLRIGGTDSSNAFPLVESNTEGTK